MMYLPIGERSIIVLVIFYSLNHQVSILICLGIFVVSLILRKLNYFDNHIQAVGGVYFSQLNTDLLLLIGILQSLVFQSVSF